jgi:hypothetical protein
MPHNKNENKPSESISKGEIDYLKSLNQLNLLPKQTENDQQLDDVESSIVIGNNANGSNIKVAPQTNHVHENLGVTGITGTGHTINIYQYPKELIEILNRIKEVITTQV